MTLAKGYLEQLPGPGNASSYRFVEGGTCYQLNCPNSNPKQRQALWQVQRIRHRDGDKGHHYHYEMKFSVTPLDNKAWQPHHQQMSYIQKESDYPASFGRLAAHDHGFAQRRQDRERYGAATGGNAEQSQATFVHGIFQPAPPPKLNIGEYLKGAVAQGGPKIELYPGGLLNLGLRPNYVVPTTFRPSYPTALKFGNHPELERFPSHSGDLGNAGNVGPAVPGDLAGISGAVTHHFHHHFYVAPGAGDAQLHPELGYRLPNSSPPQPITPAGNPSSNLYTHHQRVQFPSSNSGSSESLEEQDQDLLLRTPQIYGQASKYQTAKLPPLLIYAGGNSGDDDKSFVQSEPLEETVYRYSEPDPLYVHQNPIDVLQDKQPPEEETDKGQHQEQASDQKRGEQRPVVSLEQPELSTTVSAPSSNAGTTTETASTERSTHVISTTSASFVSTSTHFSPLRSISRYRTTPKITAGRSTTTTTSTSTEPPLNKWAKRRKEQDSKAKSSHRHEAFVSTTSSTSTTTSTTATPPSTTAASTGVPLASPLPPAPSKEVVEVLTQKSVSRSVSIKVGENGEEIPIIVDDEENEVKPVLTN